jgi:epoxyqueuosine reductase
MNSRTFFMTSALAQKIKQQAHQLGFELAGIAPAVEADGLAHLSAWLEQGFAGEMTYMNRHEAARRHPAGVFPAVRSVVMVALSYAAGRRADLPVSQESLPHGRIARYALGEDYHDVLRRKLGSLLAWIQELVPGTTGRAVVDSAPLLERDFARRAGLGWFGKNTMLLNKKLGSWFFLGALLLDLELPADPPFAADHCGSCTACLDACPTDAFVAPRRLDARRCISYLTIELRGSIPEDLRPGLGEWIYGCDVCQEVCPWNRKAPPGREADLQPRGDLEAPDLAGMLSLSQEEFRRLYRHTALWRGKRRGLLRNVAIVLGNVGDSRAIPALEAALADPEPLVREAAAWAIERIRSRAAGFPIG